MATPARPDTPPERTTDIAARHWAIPRSADGSRWWMHPAIHQHINRLVCGEAITGPHAGFHRLLTAQAPGGGFGRALSIGCGSGGKEAKLLRSGVVGHFDLFEIGEFRRAQIQAKADEHGVGDRITIHIGDAFTAERRAEFDLIYWNSSLHHMSDAARAVAWSFDALAPGGSFAMDDFVGPSRFQWSDADLDLCFQIRALLPGRFMRHPRDPSVTLDRRVERPTIAHMMATDPTEAADSGAILAAVRRWFPDATVIATGGLIYHLALNDVLANFSGPDDAWLLGLLLTMDEQLDPHRTQYSVALGRKAGETVRQS